MRVIQDSDDEFDEDVEAEILHPKAAGADASAIQAEPTKDASSSGTGSTESLKRAFAEAHRSHLQSPSVPSAAPRQDELQSSLSLPEHTSKRRKTSVVPSPGPLPSSNSPNKGPVTYGKRSRSVPSSPFMSLVNGETANEANGELPELVSRTIWDKEGTMRGEYVLFDPKILFPEPSSTVPNATLTQQRMLEGVTGPAFLGTESESDAPGHQPPEPSVPWSDIMRFTPADAVEKPETSNQQAEQSLDQTQDPPTPQRSRRDSTVRLKGSPQRNEVLLSHVNTKNAARPSQELSSSQDLGLPPTASTKSRTSAPTKERRSSEQQQYKPRPSRSRSLKVDTQELVDYSVRPEKAAKVARWRKTTTVVATTRSSGVVDLTATPHKVQHICEMGFTPTSTGRALKQNNGDITQTVDWLISHGIGEDELAPHNTPKRKPAFRTADTNRNTNDGPVQPTTHMPQRITSEAVDSVIPRESKLATNSSTIVTITNDTNVTPDSAISYMAAQVKSPKVQVVIPLKSPTKPDPAKASGKKAKRRKTTSDLPNSKMTSEVPGVPEITTEKKGRGRPKKTMNTVQPTVTAQKVAQETRPEQKEQLDDVLQTIDINTVIPKAWEDSHNGVLSVSEQFEADTTEEAQEQPPIRITASTKATAAAPSNTPSKPIKTSSRSPASKGKVSYRVGLSKRARIAPLLRTLKK